MEEKHFEFLKKQKLVQGLTPKEIELFSSFIQVEEYPTGVTFISEGDFSSEIYLIFEGEISIVKWDEEKKIKLGIGMLGVGDILGEMAFIDKEPRSSSVTTSKPTTVFKFVFDNFKKEDAQLRNIYDAILYNTAQSAIIRLRNTNKNYVRSLRIQIDFGYFFIVSLSIFAIGNFFILLSTNYGINPHSTTFTWGYTLALLVLFVCLARQFKYPLQDMGVTTLNWKKSLVEGVLISLVLIVCILIGYSIYAKIHHLTTPLSQLILHPQKPLDISAFFYFIYVYIQGFMTRGVAQSSLEKFLKDDTGVQTVIITSIMFSMLYSSHGILVISIVLVTNLFLGYIYLRHRNLLGVSIIQYVIGMILRGYLGII